MLVQALLVVEFLIGIAIMAAKGERVSRGGKIFSGLAYLVGCIALQSVYPADITPILLLIVGFVVYRKVSGD